MLNEVEAACPPLDSKWRPYTSLRAKTLEPGSEYQASREAWWNQMLMICRNRLPSPAFNIFRQNRTDFEANFEAVCSGLKIIRASYNASFKAPATLI